MDDFFYNVRFSQNRKIVIHQAYDNNLIKLIQCNDILFFDDCLYSQYQFVINNIDKLIHLKTKCIFGFSTALYRREGMDPLLEVDSHVLHEKLNSYVNTKYDIDINDSALAGFMTINELCQMKKYDNMRLALHGCCHLHLTNVRSKFEQSIIFQKDLANGIEDWKKSFGENPGAYVFPYAYEPFLANTILKRNGILFSFAGNSTKRIQIEQLAI